MILLTEKDIRALAEPDAVIYAIRQAFARDFSATLRMPVRTSLPLEAGGVLLLMPAFDSALGYAGVKLVTVTCAKGVNAAYELLNASTGEVLARMEANWLTDLRTAATSALATDLLARRDACTLGVFGMGRQATAHFAVLPKVRHFSRFLVCGSPGADARGFCSRMKQDHATEVEPVDAATCARESDVICTCTTSPVPVFDGWMPRPGTHLNLVGAFQPETREVDDETLRRSRIVVDTYEGALAEAGDLLLPLRSGAITREQIVADLHEIASGKRPGRRSEAEITVFKSVGCAMEDLVTAKLIYERATGVPDARGFRALG
jgi:alanine dehydrogenase